MTDPKTDEVKAPLTLAEILATLEPHEAESTDFIVCMRSNDRGIAAYLSGGHEGLKQLSHHAGSMIDALYKDEGEAETLRVAGRLN